MGLQNKDLGAAQGASVIVIDQPCEANQLLVSLSKNSQNWLSPVGWTDQQKVTLLDCRAKGETTEIDIPAEFASEIRTGDILVLRCSELDLEKEIIWEASAVETRRDEETADIVTGRSSGLLSRFKALKTEVTKEIKSEAQLRAEEAERAAQGYKAKMEAATAAKEEAQRKALEAAREAEVALKMEAERIAEMERAAKAFEEAERLKQDELRRVEEERRAEEARLAEEVRRIEEAREREIAAKKDAERKAALEHYEAVLENVRNDEVQLKSRLKELQLRAKSDAANMTVQQEDLQSRQTLLAAHEDRAAKRFESYEKTASKLDEMTADLSLLESESEALTVDRQALSTRLSQADMDYQQAQKEAEAAIAKAETRRAELDLIRQEEADISNKILSLSEKLSSKSQAVTQTSEKTQKLQSKLETTQSELAQAKAEIEALEQALALQSGQDQSLRLEIEATQQAIEDSQARAGLHKEAIEHLEAGGSPEDITDIEFEPRHIEASSFEASSPALETVTETAPNIGLRDNMVGRVRRSFSRTKDAKISIDVEDVILDAAEEKPYLVLLTDIEDSPNFMRRHKSSLMALGAVIGGIAILGGGFALNKSTAPKLEVKSNSPAPTQVASVVSKMELPKTVETTQVKAAKTEALINEVKAAKEAFSVKLAEVVDPQGFAFELPDMQPIKAPRKDTPKTEFKKVKIDKPASKKSDAKKKQTATKAASLKTKVKPAAEIKVEVNYPELTSDVQTRLNKLGFYTDEINGLQGDATKEAITNFKILFSMPETTSKITGAFLTQLKRAEREQEAAELTVQTERAALSSVQVVSITPSTTFYDNVQPVPSIPVITDSLPAATEIAPIIEPAPAYVAPKVKPQAETVKLASIPSIPPELAPMPAAQDVIIEAKVLRNARAKYPPIAQRKNYFVNVLIEVGYDVGEDGRPKNLKILSNDHEGKFNDAFEKEALHAIEKMQFEPKTINGIIVRAKDKKKRVVFRAG